MSPPKPLQRGAAPLGKGFLRPGKGFGWKRGPQSLRAAAARSQPPPSSLLRLCLAAGGTPAAYPWGREKRGQNPPVPPQNPSILSQHPGPAPPCLPGRKLTPKPRLGAAPLLRDGRAPCPSPSPAGNLPPSSPTWVPAAACPVIPVPPVGTVLTDIGPCSGQCHAHRPHSCHPRQPPSWSPRARGGDADPFGIPAAHPNTDPIARGGGHPCLVAPQNPARGAVGLPHSRPGPISMPRLAMGTSSW